MLPSKKDWLYAHPGVYPPPSMGINELFLDSMRALDEKWRKEQGIEWKCGIEIEFYLKTKIGKDRSEPLRNELSEYFEEQVLKAVGAGKKELASEMEEKLEHLRDFDLPELVLCKLHEILMNEELDYRFGKKGFGKGYYDYVDEGDKVFEVRIAPTNVIDATRN